MPGNHPDSFCAKSPYAPASRRPGRWRARGLVLAALAAVVVIVAVVVHLWAGQRPAPPSHDGRLTNRTDLTFTSAGVTSTYHLYADGLDWTEPVGMMIYADGSGEYGLVHPWSDYLLGGDDGLVAVPERHNMVLLTPRAPGGGCSDAPPRASTTTSTSGEFKSGVHLNWNTGSEDAAYTRSHRDGVRRGLAWYRDRGFDTSLDLEPGVGHGRDGRFGTIIEAQIVEHL